jgi:hypothetical protein
MTVPWLSNVRGRSSLAGHSSLSVPPRTSYVGRDTDRWRFANWEGKCPMPVVHGVRGRQFRAHRGSVPLAMVVLLGGFLGLGAATLAAPPAGAGTALGWVTTAALPGWADVASEGSIYPLANVQIHCSTKSLCVGLMPANPSASDNPNGYLDGAIYTSNGGAGWSAVTIGIAGGNYPPNSSTPVAMSCPVSGKSLQCLVLAEGSTGATDFESSTSGQGLDWQAADMYQQTSEPENPAPRTS